MVYSWDVLFLSAFPHPPDKDDWNPNLQIFVGALWKMKSKGFVLCRHFWKICRNLSAYLMKKSEPPILKPIILSWGWEGEGEGEGGFGLKMELPQIHESPKDHQEPVIYEFTN